MCDFSGRLIAWLDHELPADEAADIERHLRDCAECCLRVSVYERVSSALDAYCEAAMTSNSRCGTRGWKQMILGAGAIAAAAALLLAYPRERVAQPPAGSPVNPAVPVRDPAVATAEAEAAPANAIGRIHRRRVVAPVQRQETKWLPAQPAIEITIPAEAVLPPGAAPEGASFIADVSIAADGSAQQVRVRP